MKSSALRVGARTYSVACLSDEDFDLLLEQKGVVDQSVKSFIDYDEQLVAVRLRLQPDHRRELIVHELLHVALSDSGSIQDERSEMFIAAIAPRLNQIIPELVVVLKETCS